ncbi:LacI family DNA-binding transcriptional regulator [Amorphoplanes digitatis]|uniref:DNA-binding LacI/PurR family transcriptional regulator n=1 Tax=Actinoplanes digitatis TaxID=1868 RepID=A0A7W7HZU5_9ACTN|nr:LacI family DNA-binding transcriptional regulator [Actinoplanes digitatis]MBB4763786.1 DNA-binding LacI/PurR family transcriptional regulator [Actinoplanes digitatis]BFE73010.1 LacI family DNA-binding transcriptional regulator [Actinoplanes digitatis]GID98589.1 LacI family transcriptional regulator [Actinoplanes digitatis]
MTGERTRGTGRPTLDQVAVRAGVGRGTVSRVVNGSDQVSPAARAAVKDAIAELGYVPNRAARTLVTQRTDSIALVIFESGERFFAEPFFGRIVQSISSGLVDRGLQMVLMISQSRQERERLEGYLTRQHVDGALLLSLHGADTLLSTLEQRGVATVRAGRPTQAEPGCFVDADNRGGAREAVQYLARLGRRRIATITGPLDMAAGIARLDGYRDVVGEGIVVNGDFSEESGAEAMRRLLDRHPDVDAVFAAADMMAAGALRVMRERGLVAPRDIAVIGFDDSVIARHTDPPLSSVHQPIEEMGQEMVRLLLAKIDGEEAEEGGLVLSTRLVLRGSA